MKVPPHKDSRVRLWLTSIALTAPAAWPYVTHYVRGVGHLAATGFIQYDMPSYMAEAREYFDHGGLTYGNPYSPFFDTPAVYFQPQSLFLGALWKLTGASPGVIFMCFGAIAAICCMKVAVSVYKEVIPLDTASAWLGLLAFAWGGGVLALTGIAANALGGSGSIFRFDPYHGWWILNFGRNLIYPTEAFYHALFFGAMLFVIRKRFTAALAVALLLSISHPFSGVELLLVLCTWSFIERYFLESDQVQWSFFATCCGILVLHLGYYLVFLNRFPEHRLISEQWSIPALLQAENFIPADILVGGLAAWSVRRLPLARKFFSLPHNRLFLVWFLVAFALANHEFAIRPVQPLHFDRGYIWTPLFLMGVPALLALFDALNARLTRSVAAAAVALTMALLLSDNVLWLGAFTFRQDQGIRLTSDEQNLLGWLNAGENRGFTILSRAPRISYLAMTYTPLRSWFSHNNNTPEYRLRSGEAEAYFHDGVFLDRWKTTPLLIVHDNAAPSDATAAAASSPAMKQVFRNGTFTVIRYDPRPPG